MVIVKMVYFAAHAQFIIERHQVYKEVNIHTIIHSFCLSKEHLLLEDSPQLQSEVLRTTMASRANLKRPVPEKERKL